jgi:hypothetical protein
MEGAAARALDVTPAPGDVLQPRAVRQRNHYYYASLLSYLDKAIGNKTYTFQWWDEFVAKPIPLSLRCHGC